MELLSIIGYFALFLVFLGALGATMVGLPGNWVILVLFILFSFLTNFTIISLTEMMVLAGLLLLGEIIETGFALLGAERYKPSRWSYLGAVIGGICGGVLGTSILPVIGSIIGTACGVFGGAYAVEWWKTGNDDQAARVAKGAMLGSLIGVTTKFVLAFIVVGYLFWQIIIHLGVAGGNAAIPGVSF